MKTRNENTTDTKVTPFTVQLPAELDLKPKWSVQVSKNYTANVYETVKERTNHRDGNIIRNPDGTAMMNTVYYIIVRHNTTGAKMPQTLRYEGSTEVDSLLAVKLALENYAQLLTPKKTTRVEHEEVDFA